MADEKKFVSLEEQPASASPQKANGKVIGDTVPDKSDWPVTRNEVINLLIRLGVASKDPSGNLISNFILDHNLLEGLARFIDTFSIYAKLEGLPVDLATGRVRFGVEDMVDWAATHTKEIEEFKEKAEVEALARREAIKARQVPPAPDAVN